MTWRRSSSWFGDPTLPCTSLDEHAWQRTGNANGSAVSVRAIAWIVAGHAAHHVRVLRERYLEAP